MLSCVNALNGLFLFLQGNTENTLYENFLCQRPKRAFLISTYNELAKQALNCIMCQRPKRAFLISTVPSETPHKHWLSSLIFAGICLNILKYRGFRPFFGMFTVCSYFHAISSTIYMDIILDINKKLNPFLSFFPHCIANVCLLLPLKYFSDKFFRNLL